MTLVFYDIAFAPPREETTCACNPGKTRLVLNAKQVDYRTEWVQIPDIPNLRNSNKVPAERQWDDGSQYQTLPLVWDPSTEEFIGDSFDIAVHLERHYKSRGLQDLFPERKLKYVYTKTPPGVALSPIKKDDYIEYRKFQYSVDGMFQTYVQLAFNGMKFDPERIDEIKAEFMRRAGVTSWDAFTLEGEPRAKLLGEFEVALGDLAATFEEPFVFGSTPCYADFIVGGWAYMFKQCLPDSEWQQVASKYSGFLGKLTDALAQYWQFK